MAAILRNTFESFFCPANSTKLFKIGSELTELRQKMDVDTNGNNNAI